MLAFLGFSSQAAVQGKGPIECLQAHLADPGHNNSEQRCRCGFFTSVFLRLLMPGTCQPVNLFAPPTLNLPPLPPSPCSLHLLCGQRGPGCRAGAVHHPLPDRGQEPPAGHR